MMELSYVVSAVRRYWWALAACLLVGTAGAYGLKDRQQTVYASRALMQLAPPTDYAGASYLPDRYVAGQITILESQAIAHAVAVRVASGETDESILRYLKIEQAPGSDTVVVTVSTPDPKRSQQIAAAYVDTYFEQLRAQAQESQKTLLDNLDGQLASIQDQLTTVDTAIASALARYVDKPAAGNNAIPTVDQVAPELASQKAALLSQYEEVRSAKTKLEVGQQSIVTSRVVQPATLPSAPEPQRGKILLAGGILAGGFFGLVAAVVLARISPRVIDLQEASEILQQPIDLLPKDRSLSMNLLEAFVGPSDRVRAVVDGLCARAEAHGPANEPLVVAVTGTRRSAGTSTLAASLSARFAANGRAVLLVDADPLNSELSQLLAPRGPGISALGAAARGMPLQYPDGSIRSPFVSTSIRGLRFVGAGSNSDGGALRRQDLRGIFEAASVAEAEVVIFDGGPLSSAASTSQLAQTADVVVLAVPLRRQDRRGLAAAARQLQNRKGELLAVATPAKARKRKLHRSGQTASVARTHKSPEEADHPEGQQPGAVATPADDSVPSLQSSRTSPR